MKEYPNGVCTIDLIDSPMQYMVPRSEYARLHADWMKGSPFLTWVGHFGQTMTVKGARIEIITDWSADAWLEVEAYRQEIRAAELTGRD